MVLAGITTYNPDIARLQENIEAIYEQVDLVLVVDNASDNIDGITDLLNGFVNVSLIKNTYNAGVATALNQQVHFADSNGFQWVLHLDQDTVASPNLIQSYKHFYEDESIGILCCRKVDRNLPKKSFSGPHAEVVGRCMTSGTFLRIDAWKKASGYWDELFIDCVDFDFCYSIREQGYKIIRLNNISILHELGKCELKKAFGKDFVVTNEKDFRYYYSFRNYILMIRKHWVLLHNEDGATISGIIYQILRKLFLVLWFEENKLIKLKCILKGIYHGTVNHIEMINA